MAKEPDKRRRTDLDLFVLALIDGGVSTPYELQKAACLSQGASIPALQRLLEAGLVRQGKPGARGRTDYKTSPTGRKFLKTGWRPLIDEGPSGDLDSDLRVALLALRAGDRRLAARFLGQSADKILGSLTPPTDQTDSAQVAPLAHWYSALRLSAAKSKVTSESVAARAMADLLPRSLSVPKRPRNTKTNG